jgi:hypothetical protein
MIISPKVLTILKNRLDHIKDGCFTPEKWLLLAYDAVKFSEDSQLNLNGLVSQLTEHCGDPLIPCVFEDMLISVLKSRSSLRGPLLDTLSHYVAERPESLKTFHYKMLANRTVLNDLTELAEHSFPRLWALQAISSRTLSNRNSALIELLEKVHYPQHHIELLNNPSSKDMLETVRATFPYAVSRGHVRAYSEYPGFAQLMSILYPTDTHFNGVVSEIFHHVIGNVLSHRATHRRTPEFSSMSDIDDTFKLMALAKYPINANSLMHTLDLVFKRHINEGMEEKEWSRELIRPRLERILQGLDEHGSMWRLIIMGHLHPVDHEPLKDPVVKVFESQAKALCDRLNYTGTRRLSRLLCEILLSEMDHDQVVSLLKDDSASLAALYQCSGDRRLLPLMDNLHRRQSLTGDLGL